MVQYLRLAAFVLLLAPAWAVAQSSGYPSRPVKLVIPVPPGGVQDLLARGIGQELSALWGQSVITENRPGAGGVSASDAVAKAAPDGYMIFMADEVPLTITPLLISRLPYDPLNDFTPVVALVQSSHVLVVATGAPYGSVKELLAAARSRPGALNYGTFGAGSTGHLNTEELAALAGIKIGRAHV